MKYRPYGKKVDFKASVFGYGCMRMPQQKNEKGEMVPDQEFANAMIRTAVDNGVNYFDSANAYMGGLCDAMLGAALAGGYREKVMIATKIQPMTVNSEADFFNILESQLTKLQTGYIDVLLAHSLSVKNYEQAQKVGMIGFMEKAKVQGMIRHIGFSYHDDLALFKRIVDAHDWVMCNVQMNILDYNFQAGIEGIQYASERGLAVCAMEPLRGGLLANPPEAVQKLFDGFPVKRSSAEWCFRDVYSMEGVTVVLSGVNAMEQLKENLAIFDKAEINSMDEAERALIKTVRETYTSLMSVPCTGCKYCMPCPQGVNIPSVFARWNNGTMLGDMDDAKKSYERLVSRKEGADLCVECGLCEPQCPQVIPIIGKLKEAHETLI